MSSEKKIAIIGTAPSSRDLAPFDDPEWEIWTCSPGNVDVKRSDVHFELHSLDVNWIGISFEHKIAYFDWMKKRPKTIMARNYPGFANSEAYPIEEMIADYDQYFFTSSISLMMARALKEEPSQIGLWGVDMATDEEYTMQRAGCQFFIREARKQGVKVIIPPESDLDVPAPVYGLSMETHMWRKLNARDIEIRVRLQNLAAEKRRIEKEETHLQGAKDNNDYILNTWIK